MNYFSIFITQPKTAYFFNNDIENGIENDIDNDIDPNETHVHDKIIIQTVKVCGKSICKPLQLIFNQYIDTQPAITKLL